MAVCNLYLTVHVLSVWLVTCLSVKVKDASVTTLTLLDLSINPLLGPPPDGIFHTYPLLQLETLCLNRNGMVSLNMTVFKPLWLTTQPALFSDCSVFDHPCYTYNCDNLPNTTVQSFYVADQACLWSPGVSKFIIATGVILLLVFFLITFLYRYRWHIRLLLYEAHRGRGDRWRRLQERHFRYDVFVCYDSEELNWVREHLMPELEGRLGLRLCIHQRDFTLGAPIVQNIEESVEDSKKVMMIFSKNFAESHWCQFELQLSLIHVMENGDELLVVLLEDIPSRDLTPAMMAVMRTMTYIEWEDEPEARASFWGRLRIALNEILPARNVQE
nr:hypothetical protein BaRGS_029526 [Batillaria attramentaria]